MRKPPAATPKQTPCLSCRHYFITWDKARPYGCRAFNFKSAKIPCKEVQAASDAECLKFEARTGSR